MNEENKNDGLNTISLGGVESSPDNLNKPLNDLNDPNQNIESLDDGITPPPVEPLSNDAKPLDNIEPNNDLNPPPPVEPVAPVAPINYDIPESINNYSSMFNGIGTVPPIPNAPIAENSVPDIKIKKKKGMNKVLFVIIIILAIIAVGVGFYLFLHFSSEAKKPKVNLKQVELEINNSVSTNINDYATFEDVNSSTCSLDTSKITDTSKLNAEYTYTITCAGIRYNGKLKIVDTTSPEVKVKEVVTVSVDSKLTAKDFIEECVDATGCIYKFKDEEKVQSHLKEAASYKVDILISDESGNTVEKTVELKVNETLIEADLYLICSKNQNSYTTNNKFGLIENADGYIFNKGTLRTYIFTFNDASEYTSFKEENSSKDEISYNGITGKPEFDDTNMTLSLVEVLSYNDLNEEEKTTLPLPYGELKSYYEKKGYSCSPGY